MLAKAEKTCYYVIKDNKKEMAKKCYSKKITQKQSGENKLI